MSSILVWDCYQSLTKLAKHDSVQLVWAWGQRKVMRLLINCQNQVDLNIH